MARFPFTLDSDTTEVRDALEIARTQYSRGDLEDAMRWLRRAADIAFEQHADERAVSLSKAAADLGPPRPGAAPSRATESVRPRAPESFPVNPALPPARPVAPHPSRAPAPMGASHVMPSRPVTAPASTTPAINAARALERQSAPSPATASSPPGSPSARPLLPTRPAPVQRAETDGPTDAFRIHDEASTSEPILLTARKVEPFALDDDSTHVGAAPAGFLAAVAAEANLSKTTPVIEKPAARTPAAVKPTAQPSQRPPAMQSSAPSPRQPAAQPAPRTPAAKSTPAPSPQPASAARVAPQKSVAKSSPPTASPQPAARVEQPAPKTSSPRVAVTPAAAQPAAVQPAAVQPAVAGSVAIGDDEDDDDRTSPGIIPQALQAMVAAVRSKPPVHQAMRVALSKGASGVTARAVGADGLRSGEVEVMVVGVAAEADLAALFS